MKLRQYLDSKGLLLADFAETSGVSYGTCHKALFEVPISYKTAKLISEATGGKVKTVDLCEGREA